MEFALIHGEERLMAGGPISDVDLVVGQTPRAFLRRSARAIRSAGLRPVSVNEYDAGGSATVMLVTEDASEGLQLDLYFDPHGRGRLGLHTGPLLRSAVKGRRWPLVAPSHRVVYLIRKRQWKKDVDALRSLVRQTKEVGPSKVDSAIDSLAVPAAARGVRRVLNGEVGYPFHSAVRHRFADLSRRLARLRRPVGFWVELIGPEREPEARYLATRFGRYFRVALVEERPAASVKAALWSLRTIAPVRLRAGIVMSHATMEQGWPGADLVVSTQEDVARTARKIAAAMERRLGLE